MDKVYCKYCGYSHRDIRSLTNGRCQKIRTVIITCRMMVKNRNGIFVNIAAILIGISAV